MAPIDINNQNIDSVAVNGTEVQEITVDGDIVFSAASFTELVTFRASRNVGVDGHLSNAFIGSGFQGRNIVVNGSTITGLQGGMNVDGNSMNRLFLSGGETDEAFFALQDNGSLGSSVSFDGGLNGSYQVFTTPPFQVKDTVSVGSGTATLSGSNDQSFVQFYAHGGADDNGAEHPADSGDLPDWDNIFSEDVNSGEFHALAHNIPDNGSVGVPANPSDGRRDTAMGVTIGPQ